MTTDPISALPPLDVEAIKAREAAATKGPWWQGPHYRCDVDSPVGNVRSFAVFTEQAERDAEFIAHARTDIPALLAEINRLRALVRSSQPDTPTEVQIEMRHPFEISGRLGIGAEVWAELCAAEKRGPSSPVVRWRSFQTVMNALRHCGEKHYVNPKVPSLPTAQDEAPKDTALLYEADLFIDRFSNKGAVELVRLLTARLRTVLGASRPSPADTKEGWQPIENYDKAQHPLDVLVATPNGVGEARQHDDGAYGRWFWANTCDDGAPGPGQIYPTHWMPLPSRPSPVQEDQP